MNLKSPGAKETLATPSRLNVTQHSHRLFPAVVKPIFRQHFDAELEESRASIVLFWSEADIVD